MAFFDLRSYIWCNDSKPTWKRVNTCEPMKAPCRDTSWFYEMNSCCQEFLLHMKHTHFLKTKISTKIFLRLNWNKCTITWQPQNNSKTNQIEIIITHLASNSILVKFRLKSTVRRNQTLPNVKKTWYCLCRIIIFNTEPLPHNW